MRHADNLRMEGSFEGLKSEMHEAHQATRGERAVVKRRQDNLKMEGNMQFESTTKSAAKAINKVNFSRTNRSRDVQSSIVIGEDTSSVSKAIQQKEQERSVTSVVGSTVDKSSIRQQTASEGVATTVVQSKSQEATISAMNTDKFASSLRETSGVQIGAQKDISVIGDHQQRRVSASYQQQQQQQQQRSSISSARYYEQQSGVAAADAYQRWSSSAQSEYRQQQQVQQQQQQQQQHWSQQQHTYQVANMNSMVLRYPHFNLNVNIR